MLCLKIGSWPLLAHVHAIVGEEKKRDDGRFKVVEVDVSKHLRDREQAVDVQVKEPSEFTSVIANFGVTSDTCLCPSMNVP